MAESRGTVLRTNFELRLAARKALGGRWNAAAVVFLVLGVLSAIGGVKHIGFLYSLLLGGPLTLGIRNYVLKLERGEAAVIEDFLDGFRQYVPATLTYVMMALFTFLWSLLFIIPGVVAALSYSMAFYVLREHPETQPREVLRISSQMMMGHKAQLFGLYLSFFGWAILACLTAGIGFLWLGPYMGVSVAGFYDDLKRLSAPAAAVS